MYAFELLGLERRDAEEIGRGVAGYCEGVSAILARARDALVPGGRIVIVVNDRRGLYEGIRRRRPAAGGAHRPPREPAHGPAKRRVLRGRARRGQGSGLTASARRPSSSILPSAESSFPTQSR